jgi:hypothetical protein
MPRPNCSIVVCLIFLGVAVLVRAVAIAQRAYDVLLPPVSGEGVPAIAAVATGDTPDPSVMVNVNPVIPSGVSAPSIADSPEAIP